MTIAVCYFYTCADDCSVVCCFHTCADDCIVVCCFHTCADDCIVVCCFHTHAEDYCCVFSQEGEIKPSSLVIEQSPWRSDRKPMRRNEK